MSKGIVFLVDIEKKESKEIGRTINIDGDNMEETLRPFCDKFLQEMKDGNMIFLAENKKGSLQATYRASYADWDDNDTYPYYFDCAEHQEMVIFDCIIRGIDIETLYSN